MSGNQDSKEDELGKKGDGEEEEDLEVGRSSTDKLRGSGVDEKALDDVGTGKGKEIVIQTRARDDEASGEFKMKEGLGDEEIALVLLTRKAINSHQLALEIVQRLMREKGPAGVKMILSSVATFLKTKGTEEVIIVSAGEIFEEMCDESLWDPKTSEEWLLPLATYFLLDDKQGYDVHEAWFPVVVKIIPIISYPKIRKDVLNLVLLGGAHPTKDSIRLGCSRITSPLFDCLEIAHAIEVPETFQTKPKKEKMGLFERAMALCQDTDHRVRGAMAEQLERFALGLIRAKDDGNDVKEMMTTLCEELEELLKDEVSDVRDAALGAAVGVLPLVEVASAAHILGLVQKDLYGKAADRPRDAFFIVKHLVPLLTVRGGETEVDAALWDFFFPFFKDAPENQNADIRCQCAFNMPGLLRAGGKGRFPKLVVPLVNTLIADPDPLVREQMAKSIVCMAQELGTKEAAVHLIPPLIAVLNDSDGTVQRVVSERLGEVIPLVCPQTLPDSAAAEKVAAAVCKLIASIQGRHGCWRQERAACEGLGQAVGCFPPVCVQLTVLPALLGSLASSPRVAVAAGGALLAYLRDCRKPEVRMEVLSKIAREYSRGLEYTRRLLFANICALIFNHFSRQFFRILFADPILEIARDPVPMVRCKAAALLPLLRGCLRLPAMDQTLCERLMTSLNMLKNDDDKLVREAAAAAEKAIADMGSEAVKDPYSDEKMSDEEKVHGSPLDRKLGSLSMQGSPINLTGKSASSSALGKGKAGSAAAKSIGGMPKSQSVSKIPSSATLGKASGISPYAAGSVPRTVSALPKQAAVGAATAVKKTVAPAGVGKPPAAPAGLKKPVVIK